MEYLGIGLLAVVVLGGGFLIVRLLSRRQRDAASRRGEDSAEPGHYYDNYGGLPD